MYKIIKIVVASESEHLRDRLVFRIAMESVKSSERISFVRFFCNMFFLSFRGVVKRS